MSNQCSKNFIHPRKQRQLSSLAPQGARRNVITACQVLQCVELRLCFVHALLKNLNAGFGSDGDVAFLEVYPARHRLEISRIFDRLTVSTELSFSAFEFIA